MKKINRLTKYRLYFEDGQILPINPDIIYYFKLKENMDISDIYSSVLYESLKNKALFYLSQKSRTKYELISKLKQISSEKIIYKICEDLEQNGYIDDYDYAMSYILTHKDSKLKNTIKLMQKGIEKKIIDDVYIDIDYDIEKDNLDNEIKLLKQKKNDNYQIITKLSRKGYLYSDIVSKLKAHE